MYLRRKIDGFLSEWKTAPDRKPLIIKGSRQVGKTESVLHFAADHYESIIEINFVRDEKYKGIISDGYEASSIIKNISLLDPSKRFIPGKTLIFFDEITEFPEIATSLKFFAIDGRFDVICSGSMLGVNYRKIESNSVGYKKDYDMYSMDFEEFLWSKGYGEDKVADMLSHMKALKPFSEIEMSVYHSLFLDFSILGGMPAVVSTFIEKNDMNAVRVEQFDLLEQYRDDFGKYLDQNENEVTDVELLGRINQVFDSLPSQLSKENKKFQYSVMSKNARGKTYSAAIQWLVDYGLVNKSYNLNSLHIPLNGNKDDSVFKLYVADTGLFVSMLDRGIYSEILSGNLHMYKGAVFENVISDILNKNGVKLYYYHKDSGLEIDFVSVFSGKSCLIEVKSQTGNAKSAKTVLKDKNSYDVDICFKFGSYNVGFMNGVLTLPVYMAPFVAAKLSDE